MPSFDIILTTFNRVDYTKRTVASLIQSGAVNACDRFIIVDNHSLEPGMKDFLRAMEDYSKVFIITRPKNDGWATAVNDALGMSRAPFLLISNNDVEYDSSFHERMLKAFDAHRTKPLGLIGVWHHRAHTFINDVHDHDDFREMSDVPAVGWMMPKYAMEKVGMLEERGPCLTRGGNGEDSNYVQRMKAQGFLVGVLGEDVALHIDGY